MSDISDTPPVVHHYTSMVAFHSIVTNRCLWASSPLFMNDASELRHGYDLVKEIQESNVQLKPVLTEIFSGADPQFEELLRTTFLICASDEGDLLNQWQYYARAQGVRLALDASSLQLFPNGVPDEHNPFEQHPLNSVVPPRWYRIDYDLQSQRSRVVDLLKRHERYVRTDPASTAVGEPPAWRTRAARELAIMMCTFKHPAFVAEQEVRFIAPLTTGRSVSYRTDTLGLVPYLEMKNDCRAAGSNGSHPLPITEVMLGPTRDERAPERLEVVRDFMRSQGYDDVGVRRSDIPFVPS